MKKRGHIILRRRLYEQVIVFEDFLLELERFVLYNAESQTFQEYIGSNRFESRFRNQVISIIAISELFLKQKILNDEEEFNIEVKQIKDKYEQSFQNQFEYFLSQISQFIDSNTKTQLQEFSHILNLNWSEAFNSVKECFDKAEVFHTILIEIMETSQE